MTLSRRIIFAIVTGWVSRVTTILMQLIFIRVLYNELVKEEQGFWLLLGSSAIFVSLMDFGFSQILTRRIALARGKSGADPNATLTAESLSEIADLLATARRVYRILSVLVFAAALGLGFAFLSQLTFKEVSPQTVWLSWLILCAAYSVNVWAQMWPCLLNGLGFVGTSTIVDTCVNVTAMLVQITVLYMGGGIFPLAIVLAAAGLIGRQINRAVARRSHPELFATKGKWNRALFLFMISPSLLAWLTTLGAFLILKTSQYFITYFRGAEALPDYSAAYAIVMNLNVFATSLACGSSVYVSHLWQAGEYATVHALVKRTARMGMILMVCGVACIAVAGEALIDLWLKPGHFVGYPVLWTFCVMLTLEAHHVIVVSSSRATEDEAFAVPAMVSGILNLIFTFFLIQWLGLWGAALATMLAQMLTNNWYAVYRGLRRLRMSIWEHIYGVVIPTVVVLLLALALGYLARRGAELYGAEFFSRLNMQAAAAWFRRAPGTSVLQLVGAMAGTGLVLAVAMWFRGLSPAQRQIIAARARLAPSVP